MKKIVIDVCGGTGSWSRYYRLHPNYDVRLVTLPWYDVRTYQPPKNVYGMLLAPPCTVWSSAGARWKRSSAEWHENIEIVLACLALVEQCKPVFWCLENPVGRINSLLGKPVCYIQPYEYGDPYTKKTALWGQFTLPPKNPVHPDQGSKMHRMSPSPLRQELRSVTPNGFAKAFFLANN